MQISQVKTKYKSESASLWSGPEPVLLLLCCFACCFCYFSIILPSTQQQKLKEAHCTDHETPPSIYWNSLHLSKDNRSKQKYTEHDVYFMILLHPITHNGIKSCFLSITCAGGWLVSRTPEHSFSLPCLIHKPAKNDTSLQNLLSLWNFRRHTQSFYISNLLTLCYNFASILNTIRFFKHHEAPNWSI